MSVYNEGTKHTLPLNFTKETPMYAILTSNNYDGKRLFVNIKTRAEAERLSSHYQSRRSTLYVHLIKHEDLWENDWWGAKVINRDKSKTPSPFPLPPLETFDNGKVWNYHDMQWVTAKEVMKQEKPYNPRERTHALREDPPKLPPAHQPHYSTDQKVTMCWELLKKMQIAVDRLEPPATMESVIPLPFN